MISSGNHYCELMSLDSHQCQEIDYAKRRDKIPLLPTNTLLRPESLCSWDHFMKVEWLIPKYLTTAGFSNREATTVYWVVFDILGEFRPLLLSGATWRPRDTILSPMICIQQRSIKDKGGLVTCKQPLMASYRKFCSSGKVPVIRDYGSFFQDNP